jgi:epsilon-lactone hydrolase
VTGSVTPSLELLERRRTLEEAMAAAPRAPGVAQHPVAAPGFRGEFFLPPGADADLTVLHFHGGAFRQGSVHAWTPFLTHLASRLNARVLAPEYPLAPEHPFPAAVRAGEAAFEWLAAQGSRVIVSGDSAGGGLAGSVLLSLGERRHRAHVATVLLSPWLDLTTTNPSFSEMAESDVLFSRDAAREAAAWYAAGHPLDDPLLSPGLGDWRGMPPTFLEVSGSEVLRDDSRRLAAHLLDAGVPLWFREVPDQPHDWHLAGDDDPASISLELLGRFLAQLRA